MVDLYDRVGKYIKDKESMKKTVTSNENSGNKKRKVV